MLIALLCTAGLRPAALANDAASLQFTVPAPDPVQAGETVSLQALAVNTGSDRWTGGSYYWVAEIYDADYRFIARTDQVSPPEDVPAGSVAAISLPFPVPATMVGRRFYKVFLIKDARTLLESEFKPFSIVEKEIPPAPELPPEYRVEGNITLSYKNASRNKWGGHNGQTAINVVGKVKESSYLFNAHLIHEPGKVVDPFILLFNYYAPWGRIYAGDIAPTLSPLSVNGQGIRGVMLEQEADKLDWAVLGGQSITSQPGTALANGRFARSLYAARLGRSAREGRLKASVVLFQSGDESGSLSSDPRSPNFRGPTLVPQKNSGAGLTLAWQATKAFSLTADYQSNEFSDGTRPKAKDTAWRGEARWDRQMFKLRGLLQRTGPKFVAFGAPTAVGDRMTTDGSLGFFPVKWYSLNLSLNQYTDNLANDPKRVTTTQRTVGLGNAFQFQTKTAVTVSANLNTAKGKPSTALDNQTTSMGLGLTQGVRRHSFSLNAQTVQFRDKNKLAHDLDTQTVGVSANLSLPRSSNGSFGVTRSETKDKFDATKRTNQSLSASYTRPLSSVWTSQYWGIMSVTKNTSTLFPADSSTQSLNSEFTWARSRQQNLAFGLGYNKTKDKIVTSRTASEATISLRYSYSF